MSLIFGHSVPETWLVEHVERVAEFMDKAGQLLPIRPMGLSPEVAKLRCSLIWEELKETLEACGYSIAVASPPKMKSRPPETSVVSAEYILRDMKVQIKKMKVATAFSEKGMDKPALGVSEAVWTAPLKDRLKSAAALVEFMDGLADLSVVTVGSLLALGSTTNWGQLHENFVDVLRSLDASDEDDQPLDSIGLFSLVADAINAVYALGGLFSLPHSDTGFVPLKDISITMGSWSEASATDWAFADRSVSQLEGSILAWLSYMTTGPEKILEEVDASNLAKFGPGGRRREDGKWLKPDDWQPPRIQEVLAEVGFEFHKDALPEYSVRRRSGLGRHTGFFQPAAKA